MKIYTSPVSPFGERVRIAALAKGIEIERAPLPAEGIKKGEYLEMNPIAKIPLLVTESGTVIPESEAILNYLEDRFPSPSLRPPDPEQRARINIAIRITDTYVMAPVIRTFPHLDPATRDGRVVDREIGYWKDGLSALAHFMRLPMPVAEAGVSMADCVLPVSLHLSERISRILGIGDLLAPHAILVDYYSAMQDHPIVGKVLEELTTVQDAYDAAKSR